MADLSEIQSSESVKIIGSNSSGLEQTPVNSSTQGDLFVKDVMNVQGTQVAVALSTTAVEVKVGGSRLTGRKSVTVQPTNGVCYWGYTSGVTITTGSIIYKGQLLPFAINDANPIYIIAAGSVDVRITEG